MNITGTALHHSTISFSSRDYSVQSKP